MNRNPLPLLQQKKMLFLHECLQDAITKGEVGSVYHPIESKKKGETAETYIARVRNAASSYQFVSVPVHGQLKYVSFGVPGPIIAEAGDFFVIPAEVVGGRWGIHYFLFHPNYQTIRDSSEIMLRIDSGCFSGMVLGDTTCDCLSQLRKAQRMCIECGGGIIIEIPGHDGRGWGEYKMANQRIMKDLGYDTIKTARKFYGNEEKIDIRSYEEAVIILKALGFANQHRFKLATNNPFKVQAFQSLGMNVVDANALETRSLNIQTEKNIQAKHTYWKKYRTIR